MTQYKISYDKIILLYTILQYIISGKPILAYLVGGIPTPLKNMKVTWDDDIPN